METNQPQKLLLTAVAIKMVCLLVIIESGFSHKPMRYQWILAVFACAGLLVFLTATMLSRK